MSLQCLSNLPRPALISSSGLWIIFPTYMTIVFGSDIIKALDIAAGASSKKAH